MSLNLFKISLCLAISVDKIHLQNNNNNKRQLIVEAISNTGNIFFAIWRVTMFYCKTKSVALHCKVLRVLPPFCTLQ